MIGSSTDKLTSQCESKNKSVSGDAIPLIGFKMQMYGFQSTKKRKTRL